MDQGTGDLPGASRDVMTIPAFALPLRISPQPRCFAVEDATGRYVFSVHFDPRPRRDGLVPGVTREKALEAVRLAMRALTGGTEGIEAGTREP